MIACSPQNDSTKNLEIVTEENNTQLDKPIENRFQDYDIKDLSQLRKTNYIYEKGDFEKAYNYYKKSMLDQAMFYAQKTLQASQDTLKAHAYKIMGGCFNKTQNYNLAVQCYENALKIRTRIYGKNHSQLSDLYNNIGGIYREKKEFKKALKNYQKALSTQKIPSKKATIYNNIANMYLDQEEYETALKYHQKSLALRTKNTKHYSYNNIGLVYQKLRQYTLAHKYLDKALKEGTKYFGTEHYVVAKTRNNIADNYFFQNKYTQALHYYNQALQTKNQTQSSTLWSWLYKTRTYQAMQNYPQALASLQQADRVISESREEIQLQSDKLFYTEKANEINELGLEVSMQLQDYASAFYFSERNKGNVLLDMMLKQEPKPLSINNIQKKLGANDALLEYAFYQDQLAIFVLTQHDFVCKVVPADNINCMAKKINHYIEDPFAMQKYVDTALDLYRKIVSPVYDYLQDKPSWTVIPDRNLSFIPMDALITGIPADFDIEKEDFSKVDFLLLKHDINYHVASTFLFTPPSSSPKNYKVQFTGFAPDYKDYQTFGYSEKEIKEVSQLFSCSKTYVKKDASRKNVLKGWNSEIVHISTHGFYDNELKQGGLVLTQDSKLKIHEILRMKIHSDLVVLSSCSGIQGEEVKGEGFINITRAFLQANVPNIIFTLFRVYEKQTYQFMLHYYRFLHKHPREYRKALHQAKLQIFRTNTQLSHPLFWSGYVFIGQYFPQ